MKKFVLLLPLLIGCSSQPTQPENLVLRCGQCNRIVYDGPCHVDQNGVKWPNGNIDHCKPWDINCINPHHSNLQMKRYWGYIAGGEDARNFKYKRKEYDPPAHPKYLEGYEYGYNEVVNVRKGN